MRNQTGNLNDLKAQRDALTRRIEKLERDNAVIKDFASKVSLEAKELGISNRELAIALDPELERIINSKSTKSGDTFTGRPRRAPRQTKCYLNPHNGEKINTKGGNHRGLKAWKDEYGAAVVDGWATIVKE